MVIVRKSIRGLTNAVAGGRGDEKHVPVAWRGADRRNRALPLHLLPLWPRHPKNTLVPRHLVAESGL